MPLYEFTCTLGHRSEALCKSDDSDAPQACPKTFKHFKDRVGEPETCGLPLKKVMSAPSSYVPGADSWRK